MREFHASYEYDFEPEAQNNTAAAIYRLAREGGPRVLDLGSGPGIVASYLKGADGRDVTCVDSDPGRLEAARARGIERTIVADLDGDVWAEALAGESFDVIILADVLEHLVHPGVLLDRIRGRGLLTPQGFLVVSIPNASHEAVVAELMNGTFRYRPAGLLDSTHVRFFTKDTFAEFCERHGCVVTRLHRTKRTLEQTEFSALARTLPPEIRAHLDAIPESHTYQFIARVEPVDLERNLARLRDEMEGLREERTRLASDVDRYRHDSIRHRETIEAVRVQHAQAETLLREQAASLTKQAADYRAKLLKIYRSRSWKLVRLLSAIARGVRNPREAARLRRAGEPAATAAAPAAQPRRPVILAEYTLTEDARVREAYVEALAKRRFTAASRRVAMAVSTLEPDEGRGDVYTAVGLGRYLERIGYDVVYLPRDRWYDLPEGTDIYLGLLDEVDAAELPLDCIRIAWVRNRTAEWLDSPSLALYDAVLCSSDRSLVEVRRSYPGPTGMLAIGVDGELFGGDPQASRRGIVTTVNQWGRERQLFRSLVRSRLDFPLAIYGEQRGLHADLLPYWRGMTSFFALPSLYRQALVVLDDHNHTTQPFGNVNSRIFESLASGAGVITNASIGLKEIGLDDVPSYVTPEELDAQIHQMVTNPSEAQALARRLRDVVLRDHTYERRAEQFDAFIKKAFDGERRTARTIVGFYPDYRSTNPYQRMLYATGEESQDLVAVPVPHPAQLVGTRLAKVGERLVFHLHWTATIIGPARTESEARERAAEFVDAIDRLKAEGVLLVWTVHNVLPHECRFVEVEASLRQQIADRADAIHVMCDATAELVSATYTLPVEKLRVIPHPGYIDVYPNLMTQEAARAELGLRPEQNVVAFFGGIRPYKGLDQLLDVFDEVAQISPDTRLLVVGPAGRFPEVEELQDRCEAHPAILATFNRVADTDVQVFLNAADAVVLPHRSVLNSGSVMLAFSFGRPVIAPAAGCLTELLTPDVAVTFDPGRPQELREALLRVGELKQERYREAALKKAAAYPQRGIAEQFASLVRDLVEKRPLR